MKAAFSIPEDIYKPIVMFFGLTNLLVTFQAIMNDLLRDMIKAGDVLVFIDNIIVGIKTEKGNDDIMEKILRRIVENDLFIKQRRKRYKK